MLLQTLPNPVLQDIANVATTIGALGLVLALYSWRQSRAAFHQGVIVSCTTRFQKLSPKLQSNLLSEKTIRKYLELCNEELFYFEENYLPQPIIDEWVEGMVGLIGFWYQPTLQHPPELLYPPQPDTDTLHVASLLYQATKNYPRLCYALTVTNEQQARRVQHVTLPQPDLKNSDYQDHIKRASAVLEVLANLRCYQQQPFYTYLRRRRCDAWGGA